MRLAIDASNLGLGGGTTHLKELLLRIDDRLPEISAVVVFSSMAVLDQLSDHPVVQKVTFPELNSGLTARILFQLTNYDKQLARYKCDLIFSITGDYIGSLRPVVGMSQNMLLYDRHLWKDFGQLRETIRMWLNFMKQSRCFQYSEGVIFLSKHAQMAIGKQIDLSAKRQTLIHHGISSRFRRQVQPQLPLSSYSDCAPFRLLYVSTVHSYKNQWKVVEAVAQLREKGYPLELHLAGSVIFNPAGKLLEDAIRKFDPDCKFVINHKWVDYETVHELYQSADAFVFASECENMPNILLEAMSAGLPVVCSDRPPMPEFAGEHTYYFNPRYIDSIASALEKMLLHPEQRELKAALTCKASEAYDWSVTAQQTFRFLYETYENYQLKRAINSTKKV